MSGSQFSQRGGGLRVCGAGGRRPSRPGNRTA